MTILSLLIVIGAIQIWGSGAPLHKDEWFLSLLGFLRSKAWLPADWLMFAALIVPLVVLGLALAIVTQVMPALGLLLINVLVLLYSVGRGDFSLAMTQYINAAENQDSSKASYVIQELAQEDGGEGDSTWAELHLNALRVLLYRGFERLFAVFFWFLILGAPGALLYRLSVLYRENLDPEEPGASFASRWLWLIEWPAVRLLGMSWALAGNFVGCFERWKECVFCPRRTSAEVLEHYAQGALNLSAAELTLGGIELQASCSADQIRAVQALLSRSLWLWLCLIAVVSLLY